jgi:hypothetical protein
VIRILALALIGVLAQLAPGGTFIDDDGDVHEASIEAIAHVGLTNGCNPPAGDLYCPDSPVTRGQMSAFLARALGLGSSTVDWFVDDDGHTFENSIDRLAAAGITLGCNPPNNNRFCPDREVTRGQMAAMLVRAFDYPAGSSDRFVDDDGHTFESVIDRLATAGVTAGCNPPDNNRFCPDEIVTRAEMATFLTRALGLDPMQPPSAGDPGATYWAASSPFNQPIPTNPRIDPNSGQMAARLDGYPIFDLYEYGIAIHHVDSSAPMVEVTCTADWGVCPTESLNPVPIPDETRPPPGSDGNTVLVDWSRRRAFSMHQPVKNADGSWSATWVTVADLLGSGVPAQGGNGSGASHLAGVVELHEIAEGKIDHALVFSTDALCRDELRYPARKTDGQSDLANCIPAGTRVQLDPALNIDALGLSPGSEAVARALQDYGAYAVDRGGATMALYFQVAPDATSQNPGKIYRDAGFSRDYFGSSGIPWDHLRVLSTWDGS